MPLAKHFGVTSQSCGLLGSSNRSEVPMTRTGEETFRDQITLTLIEVTQR